MSADWFKCDRCGAHMGITGPGNGSDDDLAMEEYYDSEVEYHRSGQCTPATVEVAPTPDPRAEYIAGLRKLADLLVAAPQLSLPEGNGPACYDDLDVHVHNGREEMAAWAALLTDAAEGVAGSNYEITGRIHGVYISAFTGAASLGGREVTREQTVFEVEPFLSAVSS